MNNILYIILFLLFILPGCSQYSKAAIFSLQKKSPYGYRLEQKRLTHYWYDHYKQLGYSQDSCYYLTIQKVSRHVLDIRGTRQDTLLKKMH